MGAIDCENTRGQVWVPLVILSTVFIFFICSVLEVKTTFADSFQVGKTKKI